MSVAFKDPRGTFALPDNKSGGPRTLPTQKDLVFPRLENHHKNVQLRPAQC